MSKPRQFEVKITAHPETGKVHAVYLRVSHGQVEETREIKPGRIMADYDSDGSLLGVEILGPCRPEDLEVIFATEPPAIREFVTGASPRELVAA